MKTYWIDSHAHLGDEAFRDDFTEVTTRAKAAGVGKILLIENQQEAMARSLELAEDPLFSVACGFHPSDVATLQPQACEQLIDYLRNPHVVALGEIGLDYHWQDNKLAQQEALIRQLHIASALNLPVIIHVRDAVEDIYPILRDYPVARGGIMHCFSEDITWADKFLQIGFDLSFGGVITFKNAEKQREVATYCPLDRIHIETDAPYLAPVPYRGKRNESAYVPLVGQTLARLKKLDEQTLKQQLMENYMRRFGT